MRKIRFWSIAALCVAAVAAFACFDVEPGTPGEDFIAYEQVTLAGTSGYTIDVVLPRWENQAAFEAFLKTQQPPAGKYVAVAATGFPFTLNVAFSGFLDAQGRASGTPIDEMAVYYYDKGERKWKALKEIDHPQFEVPDTAGEELAVFGRRTIPDALGYQEGELLPVALYFKAGGKETFKPEELNSGSHPEIPVIGILVIDNTLPEYQP